MRDPDNKKLLVGFLMSVLLCAAVWCIDITMVLFTLGIPFFCLQLLLLRLTKKKLLRLIPVYPIVLLLLAAGYFWFFGKGWDALAALIFGLMSISPVLGCVLAAIVHRFSGRVRGEKWLIAALVLLGWAGAWWGQTYSLGYWDRAFIKVLSFGCCMGLYCLFTPSASLRSAPHPQGGRSKSASLEGELSPRQAVTEGGGMTDIFRKPDRNSLKSSVTLALAVFLFLVVGYMLLSPWLDLSVIPEKLGHSDITAANFPLVAAYITLGNSFLEELFFRGFAFLTLCHHAGEKFAGFFSALTFALYHVSIMDGWFHPAWMVLFIAGLAVGGMIFNFLDRRGSLWCGWLVHMAADLAIMLIGMRMFGIL